MMNTLQDIIILKDQGVEDKAIIDLLQLKGATHEAIVTTLNDFYTKKNATQITEGSNEPFPLLQLIILVLLIIIAGVLGLFILQG